jgi:glutamyl-Q tRNA(Asp) synthetase
VTAVASCLDARSSGGAWHVRIEDLDAPRNAPGAADAILRSLEAHALRWDGEVTFQHERLDRYAAALDALHRAGLTYFCDCSRRALEGSRTYPGTCRHRALAAGPDRAVRVRVPDRTTIAVQDRVQGRYEQHLAQAVGDFVVVRRDGVFAYQLAVVVDDAGLGVTDVVRGADLLDNTPRQVFLYHALGLNEPVYAHVPVLVDESGGKLSKQTRAAPIDAAAASANLRLALALLGQRPPSTLENAPPDEIMAWARLHWRLDAIPRGTRITTPAAL